MARTRTSTLVTLSLASLVAACASGPPPGPSPESLAGAAAKVIVIAPFNVVSSLPPELEGSSRMVSTALVEYLEDHGKKVAIMAFRSGRDLWTASMREVRDSGAKRNFDNAARVYARLIHEQLEFDALIVPSIFVQNAKAKNGRVARWDGAEQTIELQAETSTNRALTYHGQLGTMNVRAASLFVHILDAKGESIQTSRSGLELIQHLRIDIERRGGNSGTEEMNMELQDNRPPISNKELVRAGIARGLSPFLPTEIPPKATTAAEPDSGSQ